MGKIRRWFGIGWRIVWATFLILIGEAGYQVDSWADRRLNKITKLPTLK